VKYGLKGINGRNAWMDDAEKKCVQNIGVETLWKVEIEGF
jgi:hypothetical protein